MATENFFKETREQSRVKSEIIEKYFDTWAEIITLYCPNAEPRTCAKSFRDITRPG